MKKLLFTLITALAFTVQSRSATLMIPLTANVVSNFFTVGKIIDTITVTASTATNTTVTFRDSSNTTTTYVAAAYSHFASYQTNFNTVFTNESNVLITNTFRGLWTYPTSISAATNAIPTLYQIVVPASGQRTKDAHLQTLRGLNAIADHDCIVEVDYRGNP